MATTLRGVRGGATPRKRPGKTPLSSPGSSSWRRSVSGGIREARGRGLEGALLSAVLRAPEAPPRKGRAETVEKVPPPLGAVRLGAGVGRRRGVLPKRHLPRL